MAGGVYARNTSLGICTYDEDDVDHWNKDPSSYSQPQPDFTCDIDDSISQPDPGDTEAMEWYRQMVTPNEIPRPLVGFPVYAGEFNTGEEVTVTAGYIPLIRRLEDMQRAGEVLRAYRESIYDGHDIGDDEYLSINPITRPGVDLVDMAAAVDKARATIETANAAIMTAQRAVSKKGVKDAGESDEESSGRVQETESEEGDN